MRRPLILAIVAAAAVRVLIAIRLPAPSVWDGAIYARLAGHLAAGHGYAGWALTTPPWTPTAFYPPGYSFALALILHFTPTVSQAAYVVNITAAIIATACCTVLGHRIAGSRGAYLAGFAYALAPGPVLWSVATMTETLTGALLAAAAAATLHPVTATRTRIVVALASGTLLGLAALVRPQMILAAPFFGALSPATRRTRALAAIACVAAAIGVMLPWTVRNCEAMHGCALVSTNGGSNLLIGTMAVARGGYRELTARDGCVDARGEIARDRCMTGLAVRRIAQSPISWLRLGAVKAFKTFGFEWAPVSYLRSALPERIANPAALRAAIVCTLAWWALVVASIVGWRRAARAGGRLAAMANLVTLNVALIALTHAVFIGDDRYHQPLWPLLAALAAGVFLPSRPRPEPQLAWVR